MGKGKGAPSHWVARVTPGRIMFEAEGVPIIGTTPDAIDRAEDRERFQHMIEKLDLLQPHNATARSADEAVELAKKIGYPLVVRPSYVLGGRAMEIVYKEDELRHYKIWMKYTHVEVEPNKWGLFKIHWLTQIFGLEYGLK